MQGTTFVLQKETDPRQKLLSIISTGEKVKEVCLFIFLPHTLKSQADCHSTCVSEHIKKGMQHPFANLFQVSTIAGY